MVIGPSNSGKTTLVNALNGYGGPLRKTQDVIYGKHTIDVPGSYLENSWMYKYLISLAQDASIILMLVDQSRCAQVYSPGFAKVFRCPVVGVITKADLMAENLDICIKELRKSGVSEPYFPVSVLEGLGIAPLIQLLKGKGGLE